jgi:hypothetical protein
MVNTKKQFGGWLSAAVIASAGLAFLLYGPGSHRLGDVRAASVEAPVFVELFTSEGCSSCPPADELLTQIAQKLPNAIVLSEHVTYWNNLGWHDPFSSDESTLRQADYVDHLRLESSYTPQMVVNGTREFVGSDGRAAAQAIAHASEEVRVPVAISGLTVDGNRQASFQVQIGASKTSAQLIVVAAQDEGTKHISTGENGGHTLRHVMIARSFTEAAKIRGGAGYSGRITVALPQAIAGSGWHVVAFVEEGRGGPVVGAASVAVPGRV